MALITLRQLLDHAAEQGYGVPAFNINNMEQGLAILKAAAEVEAPVILQASRGARAYANDLVLAGLIARPLAEAATAEDPRRQPPAPTERQRTPIDMASEKARLEAVVADMDRRIARLEAAGVDLIEQPIARANLAGMARLAARFVVPIMADEAVNGPEDALDIARQGAADVLALKIAKSGGLHEMLRTAAVGDAAGMSLYGGTMLEGSVGSIASAHGFACLPRLSWGTELFGPLLLKDDIVVNPPRYADFELELPDGPGLGLTLDEDKLNFYRRDR